MTHRRYPALAIGFVLFLGTSPASTAAQNILGEAAPERAGTSFPQSIIAAPVFTADMVEPNAVEALKKMSVFLASHQTLEITSEGSLDVVTGENQRIQMDGMTNYKIRQPGFVIDYVSDVKSRRFIYDGKNFTVYSPKLGFYSTLPAPPTNRQVLDSLYEKFGIALPLEDIFRWADRTGCASKR
jgi:hypothetical protein